MAGRFGVETQEERIAMRRYFIGSLCIAVALAPASALAQGFPEKAIEFVVPGNPGAGSDTFARLIADLIRKEKLVAQPIVITNKAGGGGAIAGVYAAQNRG